MSSANSSQEAVLAADYERNGYLVVPDLLTSDQVSALREEAAAIVRGDRGGVIGASHDTGADDTTLLSQVLAIHFPHKQSALMHDTLSHPAIVGVLNALIGPDVKAMQSMLFVKHAGMPGQAWHQDEFYIPTRDRSLTGVWIALDDAVVENGCMWMHPGSHKRGVLWPTHVHGDVRFDASEEAIDFPYDNEGGVAVEVSAGSVMFFDGYVLHRSLPNTKTSGFRRALVNHYMSATSLLPWAFGRRLAPTDFRDIVMVSGEDPYAWRGLEDITIPFVRPQDPEHASRVYAELGAISAERRETKNGATNSG